MERIYKTKEVANMLRVNVVTVNRWLREGTLKGIRVGKLWRITHSQLKEFIEYEFDFMEGGMP